MTDTSTSLTPEEESRLIARVQAGETAAYEPLVLQYQDRVFSLVLRMVSSREDARDLAQEAFINAYRALGSFRFDSSFHTWLHRIAVNAVISSRRRKAQPSALSSVAQADASRPDPNPGPAEQAAAGERRQLVLDALAQIEPEFRDAVVLRDLQGCSYEETAHALGCAVGTVKSRIHRGRLALKERLAPIMESLE